MKKAPLLRPLKAIRAKCLDCCCDQIVRIRECNIVSCSLWYYRMGHRPDNSIDGSIDSVDSLKIPISCKDSYEEYSYEEEDEEED
jgi:hypothetical protein